jgi:DNA replication initiation complex subunit (GINS family)
MITYNDLYEALRKEKYSDNLQILPKKFAEDVAEYFKDKKTFSEKDEDIFSDIALKTKKKLENAVSNFKELIRLRKKKILNLSFVASEVGISKKDFENLLGFEKELFEEIVKSLEKAEKGLNELMLGQKNEEKYKLVRFLMDVPEFLNFDGESIGPFEKGEVANLEREIVEILVQDKKAEIIEED